MADELKGRLDLCLARLAEEAAKRLQAKSGLPAGVFDLWNGLPEQGQSGLKQITEDLIDEFQIPRVAVDLPRKLAGFLVGQVKPKRSTRRGTAGKHRVKTSRERPLRRARV